MSHLVNAISQESRGGISLYLAKYLYTPKNEPIRFWWPKVKGECDVP